MMLESFEEGWHKQRKQSSFVQYDNMSRCGTALGVKHQLLSHEICCSLAQGSALVNIKEVIA